LIKFQSYVGCCSFIAAENYIIVGAEEFLQLVIWSTAFGIQSTANGGLSMVAFYSKQDRA